MVEKKTKHPVHVRNGECAEVPQHQHKEVKTTSLNVKAAAVTAALSSSRLGFGTELSAAVRRRISNNSVRQAAVT